MNTNGLKFSCPHCGQKVSASEEVLGTIVNCPSCDGSIEVEASIPSTVDQSTERIPGSASSPTVEEAARPGPSASPRPSLRLATNRHGNGAALGGSERVALDELYEARRQWTQFSDAIVSAVSGNPSVDALLSARKKVVSYASRVGSIDRTALPQVADKEQLDDLVEQVAQGIELFNGSLGRIVEGEFLQQTVEEEFAPLLPSTPKLIKKAASAVKKHEDLKQRLATLGTPGGILPPFLLLASAPVVFILVCVAGLSAAIAGGLSLLVAVFGLSWLIVNLSEVDWARGARMKIKALSQEITNGNYIALLELSRHASWDGEGWVVRSQYMQQAKQRIVQDVSVASDWRASRSRVEKTVSTTPAPLDAPSGFPRQRNCPSCAAPMGVGDVLCVNCGWGAPRPTTSPSTSGHGETVARDQGLVVGGWLTALLVPFVGLVVGVVLLAKGRRVGHGITILVASLFMSSFWLGFWPAFSEGLSGGTGGTGSEINAFTTDAVLAVEGMRPAAELVQRGTTLAALDVAIGQGRSVVESFKTRYASSHASDPVYQETSKAWASLLDARRCFSDSNDMRASGDLFNEVIINPRFERGYQDASEAFLSHLSRASSELQNKRRN